MSKKDAPPLAVVLKGWPRLSETFIAQELKALEDIGFRFEIWSLRRPHDAKTHPIHAEIKAPVRYLPEYLHQEPLRVLTGMVLALFRIGFLPALGAWLADLVRDPTLNRIRRFGQACVLATEASPNLQFLYVHFLHTPGSVARYAALMRGLDWGFSAHARDIWTIPAWEKREKLAAARFGFVCNESGFRHLEALAPDPARLEKVYHGIDLKRFPPPAEPRPPRRGRTPDDAVRIVSIGRLVEKKGYGDLLSALADLPEGVHWRFIHIGGGPLHGALAGRARRLRLEDRIEWRGPGAHAEVLKLLREGDVFVLPAKIAKDGDRDGLPNVLLEAASQELPIIATHAGAMQDFIVQKETGYLAPPGRPAVLAEAMTRLIRDPEERQRLGVAARERVQKEFTMKEGVERIAARLAAAFDAPE
jgi:glycosyltransferase involved in cell wall biosynthesis